MYVICTHPRQKFFELIKSCLFFFFLETLYMLEERFKDGMLSKAAPK